MSCPLPQHLQVKTTQEGDQPKSKAEVTTEKYGLEAGLYQVRREHEQFRPLAETAALCWLAAQW
jgi:hypothetical protein